MAYITFQPSDYFNTVLYTGNGSDAHGITGVGFQPDFVWTKIRSGSDNHGLYDVIRGVTNNLQTNSNYAQQSSSALLQSFDSDGFTVGTNGEINNNSSTFASWNWKAGGSGSSNTDGSITSTVSANTTAGFSIVQWTGTGSNATIGHGLGVTPQCFIMKKTSNTSAWSMYHESIGNTKFMTVNASSDPTTSSTVFNNTSPTSSVFSVGTADNGNASGETYIGYFFADKKGYSKFDSYTGNGNVSGPFIYTGFKPAFFLYKESGQSGQNWTIVDSKRDTINVAGKLLHPDLTNSESDQTGSTAINMDFLSNGIKIRGTDANINRSGSSYIYMAFAEEPLVSSNEVPATAR